MISKRSLGILILVLAPLLATASPVTYFFTGTITSSIGHPPGYPVTGTITMDFANENPAQSSGTVGSPVGWTSQTSGGKYVNTVAPTNFVFTIQLTSNPIDWYSNSYQTFSTVTINSAGVSGTVRVGFGPGVSGSINFSNPSGAISANGLPLFDADATGSGYVQINNGASYFTVNSLTLVPPTDAEQVAKLLAEVTGVAPEGLANKVSNVQSHGQGACTALQNFVSQVQAKNANKISPQVAAQLIFDATTVELQMGCSQVPVQP